MRTNDTHWKLALFYGLIVIVLLATLPLVGAVVFALRLVVAAVAAVMIVGAPIAYAVSPGFRRRVRLLLDPDTHYKGMRQANDVALSPAHVWVRFEAGEAWLGADDLATQAIGPVSTVEAPAAERRIGRGEPLFAITRGDRRLAMPAPFDCRILRSNEQLREHPELVSEEPFRGGWIAHVALDDAPARRRELIRGLEATDWFHAEVDRFIGLVGSGAAGVSMADGGVLVDELHRCIDDTIWKRLQREFFVAVVEGGEGAPS